MNAKNEWIIPKIGSFECFALLVDINGSTSMVKRANSSPESVAQYCRDVLSGAIKVIEAHGGQVVAVMGDAILGLIQDDHSAVMACFDIAHNVDNQCEYISGVQHRDESAWAFAPGGPQIKIGIEYGRLDASTIYSRFLGEQRILMGDAINYAARISQAGEGNRCVIGTVTAGTFFGKFKLDGPYTIEGKAGEPLYEYYFFPMGDLWREGYVPPGGETYWG